MGGFTARPNYPVFGKANREKLCPTEQDPYWRLERWLEGEEDELKDEKPSWWQSFFSCRARPTLRFPPSSRLRALLPRADFHPGYNICVGDVSDFFVHHDFADGGLCRRFSSAGIGDEWRNGQRSGSSSQGTGGG